MKENWIEVGNAVLTIRFNTHYSREIVLFVGIGGYMVRL